MCFEQRSFTILDKKGVFMKAMFLLTVVLGGLSVFCCESYAWSGPGTGFASVQGSWEGQWLTPYSAVYFPFTENGKEFFLITITDTPTACQDMKNLIIRPNMSVLDIVVGDTEDGRHVITSAMMRAKPNHGEAKIFFNKHDGSCKEINSLTLRGIGTSGAVTLQEKPGSQQLHGSFAAMFGLKNDVVSGSFRAVKCEMSFVPTLAELKCK